MRPCLEAAVGGVEVLWGQRRRGRIIVARSHIVIGLSLRRGGFLDIGFRGHRDAVEDGVLGGTINPQDLKSFYLDTLALPHQRDFPPILDGAVTQKHLGMGIHPSHPSSPPRRPIADPGILHHQGREGPQPALFPPTSQNVIVPVDRALPVELTQVPADTAGPGLACESGGRAHCQLVPRNSGCEIVNRAGAAPKNGTNGCGGYARHPSPPPAHPPGAPLFPCARARRIVPHVGFVSDVVAGFESVCGRGGRAGRQVAWGVWVADVISDATMRRRAALRSSEILGARPRAEPSSPPRHAVTEFTGWSH